MNTTNIATIIERAALVAPEKTFLRVKGKPYTYGEVETQASQLAYAFEEMGVESGDIVAFLLPNIAPLVISLAAVTKVGATAAPLHPITPAKRINQVLQMLQAKVFVVFAPFLPVVQEALTGLNDRPEIIVVSASPSSGHAGNVRVFSDVIKGQPDKFRAVPTQNDAPAIILFTSGTSGEPKGVIHTHDSFFSCCQLMAITWNLTRDDNILLLAPPSSIFVYTQILGGAIFFASISMMSQLDITELFETVERDKITFFAGVPTLAYYMVNFPGADKFDTSSLNHCFLGGAILTPQFKQDVEKRLHVSVESGYGMTEGVPFVYAMPEDLEEAPESVGKPTPGMQIRIVDENDVELPNNTAGEITVRGKYLFSGYFNQSELTENSFRNGWFHTGDVGYMDDTGHLYFVERMNNVIKRSGYKVYASEVEQVLLRHPDIQQAAVIGVPDEELEEEIKACVVLKPGKSLSVEAVQAHCRELLEVYKYPRLVEFRESLPVTAAGKISHKALRAENQM